MAYEKKEVTVSASDALLMQLGTDSGKQSKGVDMARMGVIREEDYRNWVYWGLRAALFGSRFAKVLHTIGLNHTVGVGGRGRVDVIKGASVGLGGQVHTEADIVKPSWFTQKVLDRNWEEKERERLDLSPGE